MAKSGFWLRGAKGKLAGTVLYQSNGATVQREIVTPANPQSDNQMRQRVVFAGASKFYQNAQQNRFVLAFQNKKNNQSNFNAFMQRNLREFDTLPFPTREQANTPEFCNYFPWICTEGNLQGIPVAWPDDNLAGLGCGINTILNEDADYARTWEELIALNPSLDLKYGDIITLTVVINDQTFSDATQDVVIGNITPRWITRQFIIGADLGGYHLAAYLALNGLNIASVVTADGKQCIGINMDDVCEELGINGGIFSGDEVAAMICVTRSRREGSKLRVSPSRFYLTDMAQRIYERTSNDSAMRDAIASYKKTANSESEPANILQGSVADNFITNVALIQKKIDDATYQLVETPLPATDATLEAKSFDTYKEAEIILKSNGRKWKSSDLASIDYSTGAYVNVNKYIVEGESTDLVIKFTCPLSTSVLSPLYIYVNDVTVIQGSIDLR